MRIFSPKQIRKINQTVLAEDHGVTQSYVSRILYGLRNPDTDKANSIIADAINMVGEPEDEPQIAQ